MSGKKKQTEEELLNEITSSEYKYGFTTDIESEIKSLKERSDIECGLPYFFEIGGKNKTFKQVKDIENSFVVSDDIEIGNGNKIPLYLFGFLY